MILKGYYTYCDTLIIVNIITLDNNMNDDNGAKDNFAQTVKNAREEFYPLINYYFKNKMKQITIL